MIFPIIYLSYFLIGQITDKSDVIESSLLFFRIPYSKFILNYKYILLIGGFIFTISFESLNIKCCCKKKLKINICDDCFANPIYCLICIPYFRKRSEEYVDEGKKEKESILAKFNELNVDNKENNYILLNNNNINDFNEN